MAKKKAPKKTSKSTQASKGRTTRSPSRSSKTAGPLDVYEEWLRKQSIRSTKAKTESQPPPDPYEEWIQKQVKERLRKA